MPIMRRLALQHLTWTGKMAFSEVKKWSNLRQLSTFDLTFITRTYRDNGTLDNAAFIKHESLCKREF